VLDRRKDGQAGSLLGPLGEDDVVLGVSTRPGRVRVKCCFKQPCYPLVAWSLSFRSLTAARLSTAASHTKAPVGQSLTAPAMNVPRHAVYQSPCQLRRCLFRIQPRQGAPFLLVSRRSWPGCASTQADGSPSRWQSTCAATWRPGRGTTGAHGSPGADLGIRMCL